MLGIVRDALGVARRVRRALRRRLDRFTRSRRVSEGLVLGVLTLATIAIVVLIPRSGRFVGPSWLMIVLMVGGLYLSLRRLRVLYVVVGIGLIVARVRPEGDQLRPGVLFAVIATGFLVDAGARSRERLGVRASRGHDMLVDLRDRALRHGHVPDLPRGWNTEVVVRPAGGASFSGDFVLTSLSPDESRLELVVVDVSGKGVDSGTRSLLLSGGLSGLLGGVPPDQFLGAANDYLLRQRWEEAFATAVHVSIELATGAYVLGSAGHPPAGHYVAGSGRWSQADAHGTALGIAPDGVFVYTEGTLAPGDALLMYTDGLVETPGGDIEVGIDKLFGQAEHLIPRGFRSGAKRLVDAATRPDDDRAVVLVWRD